MQRPMNPSERLQSQTFTNGLGRRMLEMIGLGGGQNPDQNSEAAANGTMSNNQADPTMRALQNATVLQQLNGGVHSIYGSLSKMYNSTVQQQLQLLQEKFKREAENSTNPWQQRVTQQVPMFFKNVAGRVAEAQENLNRIWQQMLAQASGNGSTTTTMERSAANQPPQAAGGFFNSFDRFMNGAPEGGNFFDQFGRSLGFGTAQQAPGNGQAGGSDLASQLMGFWHNQVQPQIGMVRGQMARVWRDLTASGTLTPAEPMMRRNQFNGLGSAAPPPSENASSSTLSSSELVDTILKEVDIGNSEYSLLEPKQGDQQQPRQPNISSQMQNRLMTMQRELNQLWNGLTGSLQNAIGNVRNTLNPMPAQQFGPMTPMASSENKQEADPEENEISGKVKDLGRLQKEADTVLDTLRQQQQQQQRPGFGDRFRSFFNNVDLGNEFNQLPGRFSDSMSRFGTAVGDMWNQLPRRWDNLMETMGPQSEAARARLVSATAAPNKATSTTTTIEKSADIEATTAPAN